MTHASMATALIVEDSLTQAHIITRLIEGQGWSTLHFPTIRESSEALRHVAVQALFLDVFVGTHNAISHIDRFRNLLPDAPIVIMTAGSSQEDIEETLKKARRAKADFVLRKPFNDTHIKSIFDASYQDLRSLTRRKHVLVIDDSGTVRSFARGALEFSGYRVSEAATMEDAFKNVSIAHVDLVLCDVFMPGMGGFKGMRAIKQTWPKVKVIAMSAGLTEKVSGQDALNASRKLGADAQLGKPFDRDDLTQLVDALLMSAAFI